MAPTRVPPSPTTAIPARYREERERVLRILGRWEAALRAHRTEHAAPGRCVHWVHERDAES